ncbi:hypothetical protein KAJ61_03980 [Candidatus Parcubacteria bacterium]|nr:hypothetical protein [Candidatus Parcubacteria bacterium]
MAVLDNNKIIVQIKIKSLGKINLRYVSAGDIIKYFEINRDKKLSDRNFVEKILFNQLQSPKIKLDGFRKIKDKELVAIAKAFIEAEKSIFENYKNTDKFFKDFRYAIDSYLEKKVKQNEKLMEPYIKEAEKSFQKIIKTIKNIKKIVPKISLPSPPMLNKQEDIKFFLKSPEIIREKNNWRRHKEAMDSLGSSLETQNEILSGQKKANKSNFWLTVTIAIIMLIPTCIAAYYSHKGFDLQKNIQNENVTNQEYPFFKYSYNQNEKMFKVGSYDYIRINEVRWTLPKYKNNKISLHTINSLPKDLSWYDIRRYFAHELSLKLSRKRAYTLVRDDVECLFFMYAQRGIPVVVEINYDLREKHGLKSRDLILLNRLDTNYSSIQYIDKIDEKNLLKNLLNQYKLNMNHAFKLTLEVINKLGIESSSKNEKGECHIISNQPEIDLLRPF